MDPAQVESPISLLVAVLLLVLLFGGTAIIGFLIERLINENDRLENENRELRKGRLL